MQMRLQNLWNGLQRETWQDVLSLLCCHMCFCSIKLFFMCLSVYFSFFFTLRHFQSVRGPRAERIQHLWVCRRGWFLNICQSGCEQRFSFPQLFVLSSLKWFRLCCVVWFCCKPTFSVWVVPQTLFAWYFAEDDWTQLIRVVLSPYNVQSRSQSTLRQNHRCTNTHLQFNQLMQIPHTWSS